MRIPGWWNYALGFCLLSGCLPALRGQNSLQLGGSVRGYQFFSLEDSWLLKRRDSEVWLLRMTGEGSFAGRARIEVHSLFDVNSPALAGTYRLTQSRSRTFFPLSWTSTGSQDVSAGLGLDRLNVRLDFPNFSLTAGRQAVSWGVSYFWPAMDLFSPFAPQQIDREYKSGVDALRVRVPLGSYSEVEVLGAVLGPSAGDDGALGALLRWNLGSVDLGLMGGRFHRDSVAGVFLTANVAGTGLRGELTYTDSGALEDAELQRSRFWRGSLGVDRQLYPSLSLSLELAWNGYGSSNPERYILYLTSDRLARGEVNALGQIHSGVAATWLLHPLLTLTNALLVNLNDRSSLWVPALQWSTGDNSDVLLGGQVGIGEASTEAQPLASEYGVTPASVFASIRLYF